MITLRIPRTSGQAMDGGPAALLAILWQSNFVLLRASGTRLIRRLPMRKIKEALRLKAVGLTQREIAASISVGRSTVGEYLDCTKKAGLCWSLPNHLLESGVCLQRLAVGGRRKSARNRILGSHPLRAAAQIRDTAHYCGTNIAPFIRMAMVTFQRYIFG